jgi:hypothetical protein
MQLSPSSWQVPAWALRAGGQFGDVLGSMFSRSMPLSTEVVSRLLGSACYSPNRIHNEIGWVAKTSLQMGIHELIDSNGTRKA